jgi:hypothetical protein
MFNTYKYHILSISLERLTARIDCVENFQIVNVQQAKLIDNYYRNTTYKLLKTNAGDKYMYLTYYVPLVGIQ